MAHLPAHDPKRSESLRHLFSENVADSGLLPPAMPSLPLKPLLTADYLVQVQDAFEAFEEAMEAHDFVPLAMPADYLMTCNGDFQPTVGRILRHDLANAMNAVLAYNPDIDFRENSRDMVKPDGVQLNARMSELLVDSFQKFGQTFHDFRSEAALRPNAATVLSHFDMFNDDMTHLTQRFSAGNTALGPLPQTLEPPLNGGDRPSLAQGIKNRLLELN